MDRPRWIKLEVRYQFAFSLKFPNARPSTSGVEEDTGLNDLTSYSGKTMHSVTTLSIDFDSTCSNRLGNELNVESVPLNLITTNPRPERTRFPDLCPKYAYRG